MEWFAVPTDKHLASLALGGQYVFGINAENALELRGETSGSVFITPDKVTRLRIGYFETKFGKNYLTTIWTTLSDKPIELRPTTQTQRSYALVVTRFVEVMIANNVQSRVETGSSKTDALLGPLLMFAVAVPAAAIAIFAARNEPWWGRVAIPIVPFSLFSLLWWMSSRRYWPRELTDIKALRKFLPPV